MKKDVVIRAPRGSSWSKAGSLAFVTFAYLVTLAVCWAFEGIFELESLLWKGFALDVVGTATIFAFSALMRNSSMYDAYWSVAPIPLAFWWWLDPAAQGDELRGLIMAVVVTVWGIRLTGNWVRGWPGMRHEDWRYTDFRRKTGKWYPFVDFFGIHLFPTVQVFLGMLPVWAGAAQPGRPFGALDVVGVVVALGGTAIEGISDHQLHDFLKRRKPGQIMNEGLWKHSRHPNYLGQIIFWWGLWFFALAADPSLWWTGIGALAIHVMFLVVSVPLLDTRSIERRPGFEEHCKKTRMFLPFPR